MADVKKKATRESYGEALAALGETYENLVVLDAEDRKSTRQNSSHWKQSRMPSSA